jgi:hypothetical protein
MNTEAKENKKRGRVLVSDKPEDVVANPNLEEDPLRNSAVQEFVQGSGDSWEAQPGGLPVPDDVPALPEDPGSYMLVDGQWMDVMEMDSMAGVDAILDLAEVSEKVRARRDKWKDRYHSVKAQLIQERKRNCMVSGILIDLILKGDLNVVAPARNR